MSLIALSRAEVPATTMRATTAIQPWPWMSEPIVRPAAPPNTAAVPTRRSRGAYAPPHFLRVGIGDHVQKHGGEDLPGQPVLVHQPAARDFRAALGEPAPVVVHLGLVLARDHDRDRRVERVLRAAVQPDELLPVERELDSLDRTGGPRPCLGVAGHPSDLAVLEDAGVVVRRGLALGVEPQAGDERLVGHFSSPSLLFSSGY